MGGGLIELTATSYEDAFFINNPQITFFKTVYKRYSNFSIENIKNEFVTTMNISHSANASSECNISRSGDLLKSVFICIELPTIQHGNTIRKKFGISIDKNSVHGSDSIENAKIEINFFFKD